MKYSDQRLAQAIINSWENDEDHIFSNSFNLVYISYLRKCWGKIARTICVCSKGTKMLIVNVKFELPLFVTYTPYKMQESGMGCHLRFVQKHNICKILEKLLENQN